MDRQFVQSTLEDYINSLLPPQLVGGEPSLQVSEETPAKAQIKTVSNTVAEPALALPRIEVAPLAASPAAPAPVAKDPITVAKVDPNAYSMHKKRLEKMLEQVTDKPAESPKPIKADSKNDPVESAFESMESDVTETNHDYVPPLSSEWLENGLPHWAQERFDILLIGVNGLKLAVPLIALGQIQPLEELTPLFGQSDWFMGLQKTPIGNVKTVDTARFFMPERYLDGSNYKYVVSINGLHWGLAVDAIDQPIEIEPEAIRWRKNRENRRWMAGTVKDHMCVLLDIPVMGELLQHQDQNDGPQTGG